MKLYHTRTGDNHTVELPNDLEPEISIDSQDIVSVFGVHSDDGRIGSTKYRVNVDKGRADSYDEIEHEFEYVHIVERGMWRGNMRLTVVTLTEVSA